MLCPLRSTRSTSSRKSHTAMFVATLPQENIVQLPEDIRKNFVEYHASNVRLFCMLSDFSAFMIESVNKNGEMLQMFTKQKKELENLLENKDLMAFLPLREAVEFMISNANALLSFVK